MLAVLIPKNAEAMKILLQVAAPTQKWTAGKSTNGIPVSGNYRQSVYKIKQLVNVIFCVYEAQIMVECREI